LACRQAARSYQACGSTRGSVVIPASFVLAAAWYVAPWP
jgi:hypothetical protein